MGLTNYFINLFKKNSANTYKHDRRTVKTFTFYVPAPPPRKHGYREKEFDKIFYNFINKGYKIISFQTATHSGPQSSGLWIICVVESLSNENNELDLDFPVIPFETSCDEVEFSGDFSSNSTIEHIY